MFKKIIIITIIISINLSYAKSNSQSILAEVKVNCETNEIDKDANCDLILNYNLIDFRLSLIKMYKRGSTTSDINDLLKNSKKYKQENIQLDYLNKFKIKNDEEIIKIAGYFIPSKNNSQRVNIKVIIETGVKSTVSREISSVEEVDDEELTDEVVLVKDKRIQEFILKL